MKNTWTLFGLAGLLIALIGLLVYEFSKPVHYAELSGVVTPVADMPSMRILLLDGTRQPFGLRGEMVESLPTDTRVLLRGTIQTELDPSEEGSVWSFFIDVKQVEKL